ncbi:PhzF family phenazine biosynthesis protein [Nesterenkonia pannonica]|uniref:PhzF family phenazine biosynthesis protein n=1 Tax=Nesterenkonia pannonica TaxID=1548602 RepID=UPI0021648729|nr:PhzF family phenazine biosynthesis protein [Nesterenkonia pannonica]
MRRFRQVDVFGQEPCTGNPVAVVLDAEGLMMRRSAGSRCGPTSPECTFVLPPTDPGADYRVRIFSLSTELPFAGHPTLGTARAWLDSRRQLRRPGLWCRSAVPGWCRSASSMTGWPSAHPTACDQDPWKLSCWTL